MPTSDFFPQRPDDRPIIYAYREPHNRELKGLLKVGYTSRTIDERMHEHYPTLKPGEKPYEVVFVEPAMRSDGTAFMDHEVHANLEANGFRRMRDRDGKKTEWFRCAVEDVKAAYIAVRDRSENVERRTRDFRMRPEQEAAVHKTEEYFRSIEEEGGTRTPKFLWNAKMRFGKTFATYELAKDMGFRRVLVLTFKPAVQAAWEEDLATHVDFEGWQFVSRPKDPKKPNIAEQYEAADKSRPIVCFGSFQDFLGRDRDGRIKPQHEWVREEDWDLVVFDEYHFGAWNENSKSLFEPEEEDEADTQEDINTRVGHVNTGNEMDEGDLPIVTRFYLFLSGTPFRALNSGEFIEEQIFNWTYSDEQRAKEAWPLEHPGQPNPYEALPRMVMLTYQMPEEIRRVALGGEYNGFDLNAFFEARGQGDGAEFVLKDSVQKWLDLIRGSYKPSTVDDLKLGAEKPALPFSDTRLLHVLNHTLWYLPRVNSCYAMRNLLREPQNAFFHDYTINVCAGPEAGVGEAALDRVRESMQDPLHSRSITLTCGKLTTGVTVKPWCGIFMLTNMRSPETYFQAAFRVQSPWTIRNDAGKTEILKRECYVFDFALDRSLRMVSDYSCRLKVDENAGPEEKVGEFINFLPVLAYDGSAMRPVSAADILDIAMAGTSATLLARRWESALLVNVDNDTLRRILASEDAMRALMSIEGFRNLNEDIETIINRSDAIKKAKREKGELTKKEKKEISEEEKELKSKRKQIQEKLIKFATRIPVFMYLTDYREQTLKDVITQLEPGLFKKVTGLTVKDFELLVSLGVFNDALMNDAVYKFRRYEDSSLTYAGVNRHEGERVGLFDTTLSDFEYMAMAQQESMVAPNGLSSQGASAKTSSGAPSAEPSSAPLSRSTGASRQSDSTQVGNTSNHVRTTGADIRRDWIADELDDSGTEYVDKRPDGGCLWVIDKTGAADAVRRLNGKGAGFRLSERGGRATGGRSAWWLKGYPEESSATLKPTPIVMELELDNLEIGDTVYHKAFGYGQVVRLDDSYIEVAFENDNHKKKPSRRFVFPGSFYQGLLRVV
ncbi:MAG: GIY-YIG nuclease family protein [Atopobium sp.]|nr:GIY-YIG nuclease family protein [Olsenella sp.]MCC6106190.1 GIY-YIG nuclease family protein [Atopobium sp.]